MSIAPIAWECSCGQFNPVESVVCQHCWTARYEAPGNFRYCIYCGVDCEEYEPDHGGHCPTITGLYPVTPKFLGERGPNDPYAPGAACMDCGTAFKVGDFYAHRQIADDVIEVVCIGCRVLNPEADDGE